MARDRLVLLVVCAAQFMCVVDDTIVNIALPSIRADLGFSTATLAWVPNGYLLAYGGLLLLAGRACDLLNRRTVFLAGTAVFGLASLACGLAVDPTTLVVARIMQGAGAAAMSAAALAVLTATFTGARRAAAFGVWGGLSGAAGATGVLAGGVLTTWLGWPSVFLVNVPVAVVVVVLGLRSVPAGRGGGGRALDPVGAVTVTAGLGLLIVAIVRTGDDGWASPTTLGCLAGAVALLVAFVLVERRHPAPLVPLGVFARRNVGGGCACSLLLSAVLLGTFFAMTLYVQQVLGYAPWRNGLAFLPLSVAVVLAAAVSGRVLGRFGFRTVLTAGFGLLAAGLGWFTGIGVDSGYATALLGPAVLTGLGLGTSLVGVVTAATHDLGAEHESGLGSGLVNTTTQLGGALGVAVLPTIAALRTDVLAAGAVPGPDALVGGFRLAFAAAAGLAVVGAVVAAVVLRHPARDR